MISNKAEEDGNFLMVNIMKASLRMIFLMAREYFMHTSLLRVYGAKANCRRCFD